MHLKQLMAELKEDFALYGHLQMTLIALLVLCAFFLFMEVVA